MIYHDIEAKDLEAQLILQVIWLTAPDQVMDVWLHHTDALDEDVSDSCLELLPLLEAVLLLDELEDVLVGALAGDGLARGPGGLDVVVSFFVDRVVGQVHEVIVEIALAWLLVLAGREPREAVLVKINAQRIDAVDEDVEA